MNKTFLLRLPLALVAVCALALPASAGAAKTKPKLVGPANNAVLAAGSDPIFKARDGSAAARRYGVTITVSTSKKRDREGLLKETSGGQSRATRSGKVWSWQVPDYSFATWFMNKPGTYYWQAHRTDLCNNFSCYISSKVRTFIVQ